MWLAYSLANLYSWHVAVCLMGSGRCHSVLLPFSFSRIAVLMHAASYEFVTRPYSVHAP